MADARLIPHLHHREAAEVAHYGAKVLHPRALIPIAGTRLMVPYRASLPTPFGMAVLQATEFTSTVASSAPPAAANARAQ